MTISSSQGRFRFFELEDEASFKREVETRTSIARAQVLCPVTYLLRKGGVLTVDNGYGLNFKCLDGSMWITVDGDPRDMLPIEGEIINITRQQRVTVLALSDASIVLCRSALE